MTKKRYVLIYSLIAYADCDHFQLYNMGQFIELRASELEQGAAILRSQLKHKSRIWMGSIVNRNIGGDVSDLVHDVCRLEITERSRDNTWAPSGDHDAQRRSQNTMGYQVRDRGPDHNHST